MRQKLESSSEVFDQMAQGWYGFRHWTIFRVELDTLAQRWQHGRLLNLGCGHGADFIPFKDKFDLAGVDFSSVMLDMARRYAQKHQFKTELSLADIRRLPYPDTCFDWAIAVASYHHLPGHIEQLAALDELMRVLQPGAEAFITVWNRWQPRFWFKRREVMLPWHSGKTTVYRYYYLFSYAEIEALVKQAGFILLKSFPERHYKLPFKQFSHNICLLIKKPN
jgi:tRNA (uracil-5-)-methyltransferase TRM9